MNKNSMVSAVILAAGEGKRLKLPMPKPLAPLFNYTLLDFTLNAVAQFFLKLEMQSSCTLVIGHGRDLVKEYVLKNQFEKNCQFAIQEKQLGTADALSSYFKEIKNAEEYGYTLITCADTPLLTGDVFEKLFLYLINNNLEAVSATFLEKNPTGYGRIVRGNPGFHIVEEKDACENIRKIEEVNSGVYIVKTKYLIEMLSRIDSNNKSGEFYLTDIFKDELNVRPLLFNERNYFLGVNTLAQLEEAEKLLTYKKIQSLQENGVRFRNSHQVYIEPDVEIGMGTYIHSNVSIEGKTKIGQNCLIESGTYIINSQIGSNVKIKANSHLEGACIANEIEIGPMARLRVGSTIEEKCKVGNFVEIKKSHLHKGVKVSHLSYVGDAEIGSETNIGCGFITCNYDGVNKHKTTIGENCFIGSDSQTVAPVTIGNNCFVASSSTITKNMPDNAFAISRNAQTTKENMAHKFIKKNNLKLKLELKE